ncbi:hypothetical protein A3765_19040 [Oleiphilus sp. HI0130]|nr:hypothetical protein A3765_19040 [Oleiphilus sp. HI0130]
MRKPNYLFDDIFGLDCSAYKEIDIPILSLAFSDDLLAPLENINHLLGFFETADCTVKQIKPKDIGAKHIGHTGFFKEKFKDSLWQNTLGFISTNKVHTATPYTKIPSEHKTHNEEASA